MADIFISYSSEDKTIVKQIAGLLENKGWTVWWDRQIPIGQRYDDVIETELHNAGCVIVVWTQRSVASEWVRNEASDAAQRNKLVPVVLEQVTLPLAFKRIESAMLTGWNGETDNPELDILYTSIANILLHKNDPIFTDNKATSSANGTSATPNRRRVSARKIIAGAVFIIPLSILYYYLYYKPSKSERTVTIRVFDHNKKPLIQGDVKIYLDQYIRTESINKMGQALFTEIPADVAKNKIKIEVVSPGYATKVFDTAIFKSSTIELTLPLTTVVNISGRITTAADMPVKGVEIDVDGTRYSALTINDGTYSLELQEYTLGDEITLVTSHKDFEDKKVALKIDAPQLTKDIVLNPVQRH